MKNFEINTQNKNQNRRIRNGVRAAALGIAASIAPIGAVSANASQTHENIAAITQSGDHYKTVNDAIMAQDRKLSRSIANQTPIRFMNSIAYYTGSARANFYIENPLSATVSVGAHDKQVNLIGYIEQKGSGAGPDVVMFEDTPSTTTISHDSADPASIHHENYVIFPTVNGEAFDLNSPMNPRTGTGYRDKDGNPSFIGYQYEATK